MMYRCYVLTLAVVVAAILTQATGVQAGPVGTQGFADIGSPSANTANITTATTFTIGDLFTSTAQTGIFDGLSHQDVGSVTFNIGMGYNGSFSFASSVLGDFTSQAIEVVSSSTSAGGSSSSVSIDIVGNWLPGSYGGLSKSTVYTAVFAVSFNQAPSGTGTISDSATFSVNAPIFAAAVPEPASIVLGLTSIVGCGVGFGLRRRSRRSAA